MADNSVLSAAVGTGDRVATAEFTFSGDSAKAQIISWGFLTGSEGSWSFTLTAAGAGNVTAGTQRVTLAADDPGVVALEAIQTSLAGTVAVSAVSLPLPTGAATAAKQPALGTAGTASADVLTIQGIAAMTPVLVTLSGTNTVELGATDNAVLDAIAASLAGTLTVGTHAVTQSGAWTVDLGATDNAVLDAIAALLAGTLTVGTHAVTQSGTWDIGTVTTVTTVSAVTAITNALPAGENHLGKVGGNTDTIAISEMTRPNDTTAYAALDAVSNSTGAASLMTFSNIARVTGGTGYITKAKLVTDQSTCTARFRLHLFYTSPTAVADNSPQTLLYANAAGWIGAITFPACATEGSGSSAAAAINDTIRLAFKTSGGRNITAMLETLDAFTPAALQKFYLELTAENN